MFPMNPILKPIPRPALFHAGDSVHHRRLGDGEVIERIIHQEYAVKFFELKHGRIKHIQADALTKMDELPDLPNLTLRP